MSGDAVERWAGLLVLAFLRYMPVTVLPAMSLLRWAPATVRVVLALGLAWLTMLAVSVQSPGALPQAPSSWGLAAAGEIMIGLTLGLVIMIPNAALHVGGWVIDVQAGLSAGALFNPGAQGEMQSMLGAAVGLLATVLFFTLDLHIALFAVLVGSVQVLPLGAAGTGLQPEAFMGLVGSSFLLGLMVVAPVILGLFAVDVGVAYATRSMPQANVYFLMLPLKIAAAIMLLAVTLPYLPVLMDRLFRDAIGRAPGLLGL